VSAARVLAIGGLDPCGGAGLGADARAAQACGALALPVATALTVQDRGGLRACEPVAPDLLRASLRAALGDGPVHAIKTGLFADPASVELAAEELRAFACSGARERVPIVVDPVLAVSAGGWHASEALVAALAGRLVPLASLVTPNLPELERLAGGDAARLQALGPAVLVKGGHGAGAQLVDRLLAGREVIEFHHPRVARGPVHGKGCVLATLIACALARGAPLAIACEQAIARLQDCLRATPASPDGRPEPLVIA
jgi:hydroxymethylpyrimidine/phosphomethylpyrimidine kinase